MRQNNGRPNWHNRTLFHGDNLDLMRSMNSASVHLIATDPPFNKGRDFHATPDSLAAGASFQDRWRWEADVHPEWVDSIQDDWPSAWAVIDWTRMTYGDDMAAFLCFMAVRLMAMHRVLREDGSIYLHCDPTASHYLKTLMDAIFGRRQFRNEIVWCYTGPGSPRMRQFNRKHDIILWYAKGKEWTFNGDSVRVPYSDPNQRPRKAYDTGGAFDPDAIEGMRSRGKIPETWWAQAPGNGLCIVARGRENTGYPTQKPLALYQRFIRASSNPGDIVFDPFAGCATTPVAAELEDRQWIAADLWEGTKDLVRERLEGLELGEQRALAFRDVTVRTEPLVRDDDGETSSPALKPVKGVKREPTAKRKELLAALIAEHGMQCQGCGRVFDHEAYLEIDHILPRSDGGTNDLSNRTLLCRPCNGRKSNQLTLSGLRRRNKQDGFLKE